MEVWTGEPRPTRVQRGNLVVRCLRLVAPAAAFAVLMIGAPPAIGERAQGLPAHVRPTDGPDDAIGDGYAQPGDARHTCFARKADRVRTVCVHWVTKGVDAPPEAKRGVPAQVKATVKALKEVWRAEVEVMGYRAPVPDQGAKKGQGPNRGLDIYLADIGRFGEGGYCSRDFKPHLAPVKQAAVYCVLDDDFSSTQFTSPDELELTTAHEFFHAVQGAYDAAHDANWLEEGTAVWMEGQVYPAQFAAADGYDFLDSGALVEPEVPLDAFGGAFDAQDNEYATWLFWQFLGEYHGSPDVVRKVWERVGRHRKGEDPLRALTLASVGTPAAGRCIAVCAPADFLDLFAEFETWNARFPAAYAAGQTFAVQLHSSSPPPDDVVALDAAHTDSGLRALAVEHLSVRAVEIDPDGSPISVDVDVPDGGTAAAVLVPGSGQPTVLRADGRLTLAAGQAGRLLLVNAATSGMAPLYGYEVSSP